MFTDIEGSTRLWQAAPEAMTVSLARHDELLRGVFDRHGGQVFATGGDGFAVAFARAGDAIAAAAKVLSALEIEAWAPEAEIRVRIGIDTGEAAERDGDYFGSAVNRTARLMALAHGGQAVCTATTLAIVEDPGTTLDLGEHLLRDVLTPVHVHQIGTRSFPPLRSTGAVPSNLPTPATALLGRTEDVTAVADELAGHRLVTLTGVGGMGKTRLAVEVAASLAAEHPDGVWFVDLIPTIDDGDVVRAIALAMGATAASSGSQALTGYLAGRRVLLVLDNCEHVISAVADVATAVLTTAPQVTMLATSREPLDIAGELVRHLRPLALPADDAFGITAGEFPALQLFADRASAARAGFRLDDDNLDDVVEICRRLDGVPLAIELAAARVGSMSTRDIRSRLGERFRLLAGSRRGHERHRTLQATVAWSYDLLEPSEQQVFRALSTFAGGFGLVDATAVAGSPGVDEFEVLDHVTRLAERSLVVHDGEAGRYRLLETLRQFGNDRLVEAGETEDVRERFIDHYRGLARREGPRMFGAGYGDAKATLSAAFDNLRATAEWLAASERWVDLADFVTSMWLFPNLEAPAEGLAWLRPAVETEADIDPQVRYDASWTAAVIAMVAANIDDAVTFNERARELFEQHPGLRESAWANHLDATLGTILPDEDAPLKCRMLLESAERCGDPYVALYARSMALFLGSTHDPGFDDAIEACVTDARATGNPIWLGATVSLTAGAFLRGGNADGNLLRAVELIGRDLSWRDGGSVITANILSTYALALAATDPASAIAPVIESALIADRIGVGHSLTNSLSAAAFAAVELGSHDLAARLYRHNRATALFDNPHDAWARAEIARSLAGAGIGDDVLTPQAMTRSEIFATLAELQRRHPPSVRPSRDAV